MKVPERITDLCGDVVLGAYTFARGAATIRPLHPLFCDAPSYYIPNAFFTQVLFMAASPKTKISVAELEQQIAKISAALDKARAQEFAAAQKAVAAGQKAVASAKKKVADISAKGIPLGYHVAGIPEQGTVKALFDALQTFGIEAGIKF